MEKRPFDYPEQAETKDLAPHVSLKVTYGVLIIGALLAIGTVFYMKFEGWSWVDALFFSTETITTVGYGGQSLTSDFTKLFTVVYILVGVGIALYVLSSVAAEIIKKRELEFFERVQKGNFRHLGHIGRHIKSAASKLAYDKNHITKEEDD